MEIFITFWDDNFERSHSFECTVPIFSYPTEKEEDEVKKPDQQAAQPGATPPQAGQQTTSGVPTNVNPNFPSGVPGR